MKQNSTKKTMIPRPTTAILLSANSRTARTPAAGDRLHVAALCDSHRRYQVRGAEPGLDLNEWLDPLLGQIWTLGSATVTAMSAIRFPSTVRIPPRTV